MNYLALKTNDDVAKLVLLEDSVVKQEYEWSAGRELSVTLHSKIDDILESGSLSFSDIKGLIVYEGPGSFTGLRIGITVFNTIADTLDVLIVGSSGDDWMNDSVKLYEAGKGKKMIMPEYGSLPNITTPKK